MEILQDGQARNTTTARDPHGLFGPAGRVLGRLVQPRLKWLVVVATLLLSAAAFAFAGEGQVAPGQTSLPASAESARAAALAATLPSSGVAPAIVVTTREGGRLTPPT